MYWSEPKVYKLMKTLHGDTFIDIGSNEGYYTKLMKKRFRKVISIDPNPKWKADLKVAISDISGKTNFYIGNNLGSADSIINNPHILGIDYEQKQSYEVEVMTFDQLQINADLVKIDVEGAEFKVLNGIHHYLPLQIIVELHDERKVSELISKLTFMTYDVRRIDDTHFFATLRS